MTCWACSPTLSSSSARLEVEAPAQVLHRRDDLLLELIDAHSERARDVFDAAGQGRIDVPGDGRQRLRQLVRPPLQRLADLRRFGAHALRDLAPAVAERLGGFEGGAGKGFGQRPAALRERVFDPRQQALERRRHFVKLCPGAFLDGLQTAVEQRRRLFVSLAELLVDRAAAVDESLLDRGELGAKIGRESRGPIANAPDDFVAAPVDCAFEPRKPVSERGLEAARMRRQGQIDRIVMRGGSDLKLLQPLCGLSSPVVPCDRRSACRSSSRRACIITSIASRCPAMRALSSSEWDPRRSMTLCPLSPTRPSSAWRYSRMRSVCCDTASTRPTARWLTI